MFKLNFLYISLCPFLLVLSAGTTKKSLALTSYFPHQVFIHIGKTPDTPLSLPRYPSLLSSDETPEDWIASSLFNNSS